MSTGSETETLSREDKALLMKAIWKALLTPKWTKDDLVDLGKAIFVKMPMSKMTDQLYNKIFPHLSTIADSIHQQLTEQTKTPPESKPVEEKKEEK